MIIHFLFVWAVVLIRSRCQATKFRSCACQATKFPLLCPSSHKVLLLCLSIRRRKMQARLEKESTSYSKKSGSHGCIAMAEGKAEKAVFDSKLEFRFYGKVAKAPTSNIESVKSTVCFYLSNILV